jgi:hypothetical protein
LIMGNEDIAIAGCAIPFDSGASVLAVSANEPLGAARPGAGLISLVVPPSG